MPVALAGAANCNEAHRRHSVVHGGFRLFVPARFACLERRERAAGDRNDKSVGQSVIGSKGSSQAELDLAYARAAAAEALSRSSRDASLPWQNPRRAAPAATSLPWRRPTRKRAWTAGTSSAAICTDAQDWLEGAGQREVGGKAAQAPEIELIALSTIAVAQFACIAGHAFYSHIEVASRGGPGAGPN
jgi:hypothetical protein